MASQALASAEGGDIEAITEQIAAALLFISPDGFPAKIH
jgi:hypothetical protein